MKLNKLTAAILAAATTVGAGFATAADSTNEDLLNMIEAQQQQLEQLKEQLQSTDAKVEATADAVEQVEQASESYAATADWFERTTLGGYAELHYNNLEEKDGTSDKSMDLHRYVLFVGHEFNDDLRFYSELEVEHGESGDGKEGEVEVEQAFIEYDYAENHSAKAGVFLMPVGIINETHEPDTFYGVERNNVEKNIVPSTWWEGGVLSHGEIAPGISYDASVTSGLYVESGDFKIRDGRQKASKAEAETLAYTGRIKYTAIQGLELAATMQYQEDLAQDTASDSIDATLFETHAVYNNGPFALRALYATWDINSDINATAAGADEQTGWYVEPSWRVSDSVGVFTRYSVWDNQAGDSTVDSEISQVDLGINYYLHPQVVLKADYQWQDATAVSTGKDGFNLGVGVSF